jgi:hypothetical protein
MTYDVILPETAQEHEEPLIPKHNNIYKKIFNALPVIHNYQAWKDVLKLNIELPKYFLHFFHTAMTLTFIYYKLIKIHCCKSNHTKDTTHSETAFFFVPIFNYIHNIYINKFFNPLYGNVM